MLMTDTVLITILIWWGTDPSSHRPLFSPSPLPPPPSSLSHTRTHVLPECILQCDVQNYNRLHFCLYQLPAVHGDRFPFASMMCVIGTVTISSPSAFWDLPRCSWKWITRRTTELCLPPDGNERNWIKNSGEWEEKVPVNGFGFVCVCLFSMWNEELAYVLVSIFMLSCSPNIGDCTIAISNCPTIWSHSKARRRGSCKSMSRRLVLMCFMLIVLSKGLQLDLFVGDQDLYDAVHMIETEQIIRHPPCN